ncbi:SDR family oxidoreductase [Chloroflexi bacterium TSY]|nr:SDR family oxidoreductase [Chloroflexi bacterium TSY]
MNHLKLNNKIAVITGGNSGIGLATAKLFHQEGAIVIITGRDQARLDKAAQEIGERSEAIRADTSQVQDVVSLFNQVEQRYDRIDILFVNAAIAKPRPIAAVDEAVFDEQMDTNVKGVFFTVQQASSLLSQGASVILNTGVANQVGMANNAVFAASKAAIRSLARTLSASFLDRNIRVNALSPGITETPFWSTDKLGIPQEAIAGFQQQLMGRIPLHRMGRPDEIAKVALFLASEDSSFLLGTEVVADGGFTQL